MHAIGGGRQNNMVKGLMKESEEEMAKLRSEKLKGLKKCSTKSFHLAGITNMSRKIGRKQLAGTNVITLNKNTALYQNPRKDS